MLEVFALIATMSTIRMNYDAMCDKLATCSIVESKYINEEFDNYLDTVSKDDLLSEITKADEELYYAQDDEENDTSRLFDYVQRLIRNLTEREYESKKTR